MKEKSVIEFKVEIKVPRGFGGFYIEVLGNFTLGFSG